MRKSFYAYSVAALRITKTYDRAGDLKVGTEIGTRVGRMTAAPETPLDEVWRYAQNAAVETYPLDDGWQAHVVSVMDFVSNDDIRSGGQRVRTNRKG